MRRASLFKLRAGDSHKYAVRIHRNDGKTKIVKFGENGAPDFTTHKDPDRRMNYLSRHGRITNSKSSKEMWQQDGIFTAGYWSRWLLWEKDTLKDAIEFMKKRKNIDITKRNTNVLHKSGSKKRKSGSRMRSYRKMRTRRVFTQES